jgi:hypothetical protein
MAALARDTEPRQNFRLRGAPHKFFEGERHGATFRIRRILRYSNGFLPQIRITAAPHFGGALITVSMHPPYGGMVIVALWGLGMLFAAVAFSQQGAPGGSAFFPFGFVLFVVVLGLFLFNYEADKAQQKLIDVFRGTIAPKDRPAASTWPNA